MSLLTGFTSINESTITNDISNNLYSFLDYGLLEKGNFVNVNVNSTGVFGGEDSRLRHINDPRYSTGQVWQAFRSNWVWESGLGANTSNNSNYPGISGVYIDNVFYPVATTGRYAYTADHVNGRIIFDSGIPSSSVVKCSYSYKYINVTIGDFDTIKQIHQNSNRSESENFKNQSGEYGQFAENRIQLPAIVIEPLPDTSSSPFALGGLQYIRHNYAIHCIAEDSYTRNFITDVVLMQKEKTFQMYNLNNIASTNKFPLDYQGVPNSGALTYYNLVEQYPGAFLNLKNMKLNSKYDLGDLHVGTVKCTTEVIFGV